MTKPKIAITTSTFAVYSKEPLELLEQNGFDYVLNPYKRQLTEAELPELAAGCTGVVAGTERLGREQLEALLPDLRCVSRCGVGMDNVDMQAAQELGILVRNTPGGPTLAVAELALGLALDLLRNVSWMDRELRGGVWKKRMGFSLQGKKVGVIGFGNIGKLVAQTFAMHGTTVRYSDPMVASHETFQRMDIMDLLCWADIVTLHCNKQRGCCHVLGREELSVMKQGSWLINCARGGLVDETALHELLVNGHLAGAAIDVFNEEPYKGPLAALNNVILTPHIGSYAREGRIQMEIDAVKNLLSSLGACSWD